ncbi:MAG: hypothetical protein ACRCTW_02575, partial [Lactococcus garvieae]
MLVVTLFAVVGAYQQHSTERNRRPVWYLDQYSSVKNQLNQLNQPLKLIDDLKVTQSALFEHNE